MGFDSAKETTYDGDLNEDVILEDRGVGEQKRSGDANPDAPPCESAVPGSDSLFVPGEFPPTYAKPKGGRSHIWQKLRRVTVRSVKTTKVSEHSFDSMTTTDRAGDSRVGIARSKNKCTIHVKGGLEKRRDEWDEWY